MPKAELTFSVQDGNSAAASFLRSLTLMGSQMYLRADILWVEHATNCAAL